ncbi:MAG: hypothetical protein GXY34_00070 [Syntrophomonadaceae bacterium]|nr:hypothetical protein [Syntrophomonadaceae bacterium]
MDDLQKLSEAEIINRLLSSEIPQKTVTLQRLGIPVTLKGLTGKEVFAHQEKCTRKGKDGATLDEEAFKVGLIAAATVSPDWGNKALLEKYNASGKEEVIKRLLLAGELSSLGEIVMELSGFEEDLVEVKN